ncbi:MAG: phospho-sugar mutase [Desulfobacterales bacterium]
MVDTKVFLKKVKIGFRPLNMAEKYKIAALKNLESWLTDGQFKDYVPQIQYLIRAEKWNLLLDSFYQVIPFGTGGRRGPVGIGPNRINPWTIQASAQGHCQYLFKHFGAEVKNKGVILTYDVRKYTERGLYNDSIFNPVMNLEARDLAEAAAEVYAANGIKTFMFDDVRSTPELSFAIRYLNAAAGDMFSASHNLPIDNGKKIYDHLGGQLIPPFDQILVDEVTQNVHKILHIPFQKAVQEGLVVYVSGEVSKAFIHSICAVSMSKENGIRILYSPLHGTGLTSVYPALRQMGFHVDLDLKTSNLSGAFENVTFNIPNPEVEQSFDTSIAEAEKTGAELIMNTDPDADRIGIMAKHQGSWQFLNGNEIAILLTEYAASKFKSLGRITPDSVVIKTEVTTSLIEKIAENNHIKCIGNLLVGFKYIGQQLNILEQEGKTGSFLLGAEESHGILVGDYCRDKDAAGAAIWLGELASEQKKIGSTLVDFLNDIYSRYGYCHNHLTEIRLLGAKGVEQISNIMDHLRSKTIKSFDAFFVKKKLDRWQGEPQPHLSSTDTTSRNVLAFIFKDSPETQGIRVTVRPSGTEPKIKMYFEIIGKPFSIEKADENKKTITRIRRKLEKSFMDYCYHILGIDFPERGYLLFWQLPLELKLKYFETEPQIFKLREITDKRDRLNALSDCLCFMGSNSVEKADPAFKAKYQIGIMEFLGLD